MNCDATAAILDSHRSARLTAAEHTAVDTHLISCEDCAAAWHAHSELLALRVPPVPATLLDRALHAARAQPSSAPRRLRTPIVVASVVLAGAALAGIAVVTLTAPPSADTAAAPTSATSAPATAALATAAPARVVPAATGATQPSDRSTDVGLVNTSLQLAPFVRMPPDYPEEARAANVEGYVIVEFTVTAAGEVEDAHVVESTDARLDAGALKGVVQWKYLPRIVAGKRAATENVRTKITFQNAPTPALTPAQVAIQRANQPAGPGLPLDSAVFGVTMMTAWQRVISDDLRGAELALDEFRATYALSAFTQGEVWNAYAYVYTLQGSYDRAIDAYETAIAVFARAGLPTQGRWVELANLYFARNQYDLALNTLLRPQRASGTRRATPEAEALLEKLRALGITEETVPAR
jgi:TonB family protein